MLSRVVCRRHGSALSHGGVVRESRAPFEAAVQPADQRAAGEDVGDGVHVLQAVGRQSSLLADLVDLLKLNEYVLWGYNHNRGFPDQSGDGT